jgi:hypothetical protein
MTAEFAAKTGAFVDKYRNIAAFAGMLLLAACAGAGTPAPKPSAQASLPPLPPVPTAESYLQMTGQQRYDLRISMRQYPDEIRKPWLAAFKKSALVPLSEEVYLRLHEERERLDRVHGTVPLD